MGATRKLVFQNTLPKININRATYKELISLPGIGDTIANRILDYRQKHGKFKSLEELLIATNLYQSWLDRIEHRLEL